VPNSQDLAIWIVAKTLRYILQKVKLKNPKKSLNDYAKYSSISFQMVAIILIGVFVGVKLDEWITNGTPIFTLLFTVLAVILAIYYVIKDLIGK
jgi:F0F1-type ATP synthase assembly protein I